MERQAEAGWSIILSNARTDTGTPDNVSDVRRVLALQGEGDLKEMLARYLKGEDGREPRDQGVRIDPVLLALLRHHGIRPLRLLRIRHLGLGFDAGVFHDGWGKHTGVDDSTMPDLAGWTGVGPGTHYDSERVGQESVMTVSGAEYPESLLSAAEGRPLREMLSHPALDGMPIMIRRAAPHFSGTATTIELVSLPRIGQDDPLPRW